MKIGNKEISLVQMFFIVILSPLWIPVGALVGWFFCAFLAFGMPINFALDGANDGDLFLWFIYLTMALAGGAFHHFLIRGCQSLLVCHI
jgi:hypothetical protein